MKPFDLSAAVNGAKLVTRDGREVTEFYYFNTVNHQNIHYPVCAVTNGVIRTYNLRGKNSVDENLDLFLKSEKKKLFVGIVKNNSSYSNGTHHASICFSERERVIEHIEETNSKLDDWQIVEVEILI